LIARPDRRTPMPTDRPVEASAGSAAFKLQLAGQSLRFRLDENALARLLAGDTLSDHTRLDAGQDFTRSLCLGAGCEPGLQIEGSDWRLQLPAETVRAYVARLPCREGLAFTLKAAPGCTLDIRFEVDVRDSRRARSRRPTAEDRR